MKTKSTRETQLRLLAFGATCVIGALVSGCGNQQFTNLATTQNAVAPGSLQIKPKIDVLLIEDDTGRIQDNYSQIASSASGFLSALDQQGWNYRFATARLTTYTPLTQAVSSTFDPDWGTQWIQPYPGACYEGQANCPNPVDQLPMSIFSTVNYGQMLDVPQYSGFLQQGEATNVLEGQEPGFLTMLNNIQGIETNSAFPVNKGFFRSDALTAIVMIGTGNDTSYVNYCHRADGVVVPCEQVTSTTCTNLSQAQPTGYPAAKEGQPTCGSSALSLSYFEQQFQSLKPVQGQVQMFSAVASYNSAASGELLCAGGEATAGTRYQQMAQDLGGQTYDVCSQPLSSILPNIAQNLTTTALAYQQDYIVMQQQPDPSTISVVENVNGSQVTIAQDANNGWTYAGLMENTPVIDYPIPLNYETGYMIQLHGSAILVGSSSAAVTYKTPTGSSVSQGN